VPGISGGGHLRAGECRAVASEVSFEETRQEFLVILEEMRELASRRESWTATERDAATVMGLT
jgi:hypothetical protein